MELHAIVALAAKNPTDVSLWLALGLPIGIAIIGFTGTLGVMFMQLRARRVELQIDRDERASVADNARIEREQDRRAIALEQIIAEIADHATTLGEAIRSYDSANLSPDARITFPSNFRVKRAVAQFTTRARERRLTSATLNFLAEAMHLTLNQQPYVYGILQERLECWFTGESSIETTLQLLKEDAECFSQGNLPPLAETA